MLLIILPFMQDVVTCTVDKDCHVVRVKPITVSCSSLPTFHALSRDFRNFRDGRSRTQLTHLIFYFKRDAENGKHGHDVAK